MSHRVSRALLPSRLAPVVLVACLAPACAPSTEEVTYLAQRELLLRQNQGIRELIAEAEQGSLVPSDRFLVGLDEDVVAQTLRSQLPLERALGKHFVVEIERAQVLLRDKFGTVTLEGNVRRAASTDRRTALRIHGGLGEVTIDPATDLLNIRIAVDHIELLEAGMLESILGRAGRRLLAQAGRDMLEEALPGIEIPVGLVQRLQVPSIREGGIALDSLVVPLDLSVERVLAAGGKLWVTIDAKVGEVQGAEEGVSVAVQKGKKQPAADSGGGQ